MEQGVLRRREEGWRKKGAEDWKETGLKGAEGFYGGRRKAGGSLQRVGGRELGGGGEAG